MKRKRRAQYCIVGNGPWAVQSIAALANDRRFSRDPEAGEYDLLESHEEAVQIRDALNAGIGPEWDAVEKYLAVRKAVTP